MGFIGTTNYSEGPCSNSIMFAYLDEFNSEEMWVAWDPSVENCDNLDIEIDNPSKTIYGVCEIEGDSNQDILFFADYPLDWDEDSNLNYQIINESENLMHPQIFVTEDQIYIAAETDTQGIVIFNSSDGGNTWVRTTLNSYISPDPENPENPLVYANETHLVCTFIDSGNISLTSTPVNDFDWSDPIQLNDVNGSVVSQYRFSDIADMNHIVWTDNREGNYDLYSAVKGTPKFDLMIVPESVNITSEGYRGILTSNRLEFTVRNSGDAFVEDIDVDITYQRLENESQSTGNPAYIYYLDSNSEKSFNIPLFRLTLVDFIRALWNFINIQNITITVDPNGKYEDANPDDNSFTFPVTYAEIFPKLAFIENILG